MSHPSIIRRLSSVFSSPDVGVVDVVPPSPRGEREGLAIIVIVRDAADRIAEWVDFHLLAGVRHIFVYDDLSSDGTTQILADYARRGVVTVVPWHVDVTDSSSGRWMSQQILAYAHAIQTFGAAWRHFAFIDDDEFLVPTGPEDLPTVLARLGSPVNLSLPWHMFGTNGHRTPPEGGAVANYTRRSVFGLDRLVLNFKCVVDPTRVCRVSVHAFETIDLGRGTINTLGRRADDRSRWSHDFLTSEGIQLNHYFTRSWAELEAKLVRGSVNGRSDAIHRDKVLRRAAAIERETVEDTRALEFLARVSIASTER